MVSKVVLSFGIVMLLGGAGIGYTVALLTIPVAEDEAQSAAIQKFRTFLTCITPSHDETEVTPDTWVHYNFDGDGNLMMIEIETTRRQDSPAWGHLPEGHPGMEFEHWALHIWFKDPEEACLDLESLVEKLRAEGLTVEAAGEVEQPFFSVKGHAFQVDGDTVQVYVYDGFHTATNEGARVSADGATIGNTAVEWIAPPHFYQHGKMIIIYLGDDAEIKQIFERTIGYQFAGQ